MAHVRTEKLLNEGTLSEVTFGLGAMILSNEQKQASGEKAGITFIKHKYKTVNNKKPISIMDTGNNLTTP
ncbi:hypothetical protein QFZ87_003209 [Bacillus sp. SLBN-46]|jgi:hypothetical protein|uniref:hypothetical protein n=1 Tax=Bacillus sp. SLBN-46 TaxID=3042283 RepID=UPI002861E5BB|nr:hypothetical protein [Bacillus sp. SLBN-46]MDR6123612.1 hypothetical protein [Bacillus sp. SLBN-46]